MKQPKSTGVSHSLLSSFERAAATYLAHAGVQTAMAEWLAEWLPAERAGRALEVGAGPGIFTRLLLPWAGPLTASDLSPAMCAAGRGMLPDLRWRVMAAEAPEKGPWDWIFSSSLLQWTVDPAAVFGAWRACLAPGGRVLSGLFVKESLPEWRALAGDAAPLAWRTMAEWREHLNRAGFQILRDEAKKRVFTHPSAHAFLRSLHGVGAAPARRFSAGRLRRLLNDYEARHGTPQGAKATWTFYRFEAKRQIPLV
jgi:malonyl-CoA O-methyltransferase